MKYLVRTVLSFASILLFVCSVAFAGAVEHVRLFVPSPENPVSLGIVAVPGAQYGDIDRSQINLIRTQQDIEVPDVALSNAQTVTLSLHAFSVFTPDAKFYAVTNSGINILPAPDISLYRGTVVGDDSSSVYLAVGSKMVTGFITTGGRHYSIGTMKADAASGIIYQLYDMANVPPGIIQASCAASDGILPPGVNYKSFEQQNGNNIVFGSDHPETQVTAVQFTVPIAVDVDYEAYQFWNNDSSQVEQYVAQMFGAISTVYQNEANVQINISFFRVWETPDEPYTDQPSGVGFDQNGIDSAIQQEASYWQQSMDTVNRASVMLITKKNMCGNPNASCGLGYMDYFDGRGYHLGVLCNDMYAYAITCVSGNTSFPQEDQIVAAHELGHNFGCHHTQDCFWMDSGYTQTPIDMCAPPENGSCFSGTAQSVGTIMSYCNQVRLTFGTVVGTWLTNHIVQNERLWTCMVPAQKITAVADSIDFGAERIRMNKDTTFNSFLTNNGAQPVTVNSMKITGANGGDFSFVSGQTPIPFTLSPGQRHAVKMRFTPSDSGDRIAQIAITSTASGLPIIIGLHGFGASTSAVNGGLPIPQMFSLYQNFPNPVIAGDAGVTTTIHYSLATESGISLSVYDLYGRTIARLVSGVIAPGSYSIVFDASSLPSGTYYYKLQSVSGSLVRMLTVVR